MTYTSEKSKQIALARLDLIHQCQEFRKKSTNKLQADYDFVKLHKNLHNDYIPTIEETIKIIDMWLNFKNSQPGSNVPNKAIAEVLEDRKRQNINIDKLDDLMLATKVKIILKNMNI